MAFRTCFTVPHGNRQLPLPMASLVDYYVTFHSGPLGCALEAVHGLPVVTRFVATASGEAGQAATLGITLGSVIAEVVSCPHERTFKDVIRALREASRPMRVRLRRLAQVLLPVPSQMPLALWRGVGSVHLQHANSAKLCILSGPLCLFLVQDYALGFRVVLQGQSDASYALELLSERRTGDCTLQATAVITKQDHALVHATVSPSSGSGSHGSSRGHGYLWRAAGSVLSVDVRHAALMSLVTASDTNAGTLGVIAGHASYGDVSVPPVALCLPDTAPCRSHVSLHLQLHSAQSTQDLLHALITRRMPTEIALQAQGMGGPRVLLRGNLRLYKAGLLQVGWQPLCFELRSNGALQWFAQGSENQDTRGSGAYFWRPKGGASLANSTVLSRSSEVASCARLQPGSVIKHHVFAITIRGETSRNLVLSAPSAADKSAWVQALVRTGALMGGHSTAVEAPLVASELPRDLQQEVLMARLPESVSALAAAQDALWSATQGGAGGETAPAAASAAAASSSTATNQELFEALRPAHMPALTSAEVLSRPVSGSEGGGERFKSDDSRAGARGRRGELPLHSSGEGHRTSSTGAPAQGLAAPGVKLRWGSVEDLYRLRVPARSRAPSQGEGGGSSSTAQHVYSPVLEDITNVCACDASTLVSGSLYSVTPLQAALAFKCAHGGQSWTPALHSSAKRLLWHALGHMWHTPMPELEAKLRSVGCLPPTMAQGLRAPAVAVPIADCPPADSEAHPPDVQEQSRTCDSDSTAAPPHSSWAAMQSAAAQEGHTALVGALQQALSSAVFAALNAAVADAMLYFSQPKEAFSLLITASREVDEWLGGEGRQGPPSGSSVPKSPTRASSDKWYPLSDQQRAYDCKNGVLRRHHFTTLVSCFFEMLADPFSGGAVFDALVEDTLPISMQVQQTARGGRSSTLNITERVMTFDVFQQYLEHLASSVLHPPSVWDALRASLRLDPRELLVRLEEGVQCVVSAKAAAPVQQAAPLPHPHAMLPALLGMPSADSVTRVIRSFTALLPEGHSKSWGAMHAPMHSHRSLLPPKRVLLQALQQLPVNVGRARSVLRKWMNGHVGQDMGSLWPQAISAAKRSRWGQAAASASNAPSGGASVSPARRVHRALIVPYPEQAQGEAIKAQEPSTEGGAHVSGSDVQIPFLGAVKRKPLGLTFVQWRRQRRRVARAYQIARKVSLQQAAAATGGRRQLKAARPDKTASSDLQHEISNMFSAKRLGAQALGEKVDSSSDSSDNDLSTLTRKQLALLQLLPPPGQGDSGDYTTVTSNTDDSFGDSSDEEADLRWLQSTLVPDLGAPGRGSSGQVDEELLTLLDSPVGRAMVQQGAASVKVSGKLLVTDRSAYLVCGANEVLVLPMHAIGHMEYCTTTGSTMRNSLDNGLHIADCDLRRVARDESMDDEGEPSELKTLFTLAQVVARPSPTQLRTLHVFRWQLAVEQILDAYYAAPTPSKTDVPFASANDDFFTRELGLEQMGLQGGSAAVDRHLANTFTSDGPHLAHSPVLRKRALSEAQRVAADHSPAQSAGGGYHASLTPSITRLSGNRSVVSLRGSSGESPSSKAAVRADAALAASIGVLRSVWDIVQSFQYSATYNGAFGQPQMLLPGSITPSCTLVFSKMKDFVLGQGEERIGGRRRVVREALEELAAAQALTPALGIAACRVWNDAIAELGWAVSELSAGDPSRCKLFSKWLKARLVKPVQSDQAAAHRLAASCAVNLIRTRALLKCTGRCTQSLLYCTSVLKQLRLGRSGVPAALEPRSDRGAAHAADQQPLVDSAFSIQTKHLHDLAEGALFPADPSASAPRASVHVDQPHPSAATGSFAATQASGVLSEEYATQSLPTELVAEQALLRIATQSEPKWLLRSVGFVTRCEQLDLVRDAQLGVFDRSVMTHQWRVLSSSVLKPYQTARAFVRYVLKWENPVITFPVLISLLLLAWWDLLAYLPALLLFFGALAVLVWGGLKPSQRKWLQGVLFEPPKRAQSLNWVQRYRQTSKVLGKAQLKMHKYLQRWQRLLAILTWKSPEHTRLSLLCMILVAIVLCVVPFRVLFVLFVAGQFSKPLRDNASGLYKLGVNRFLQGLPLPSLAAAVYAETPGAALANVPQGSVVQTLSSMQGEELAELGGDIQERM